jgi:hypothetical protein
VLQLFGNVSWFALAGAGWDDVTKVAVHGGCIPIVIQDDVEVEFEGVLPYKDFAVRVRERFFFELPAFLEKLLKDKEKVSPSHTLFMCTSLS